MAIDRAPWNALTDDDGSNLVGSLWNKAAIKTVLLDPIDVMYAAQTWTPVDVSGAGLPFVVNTARYVRVGPLVALFVTMSWPSTSSGAAAKVGNLPLAVASTSGLYTTYGTQHIAHLAAGDTAIQVFNPTTGGARTNAELSGSLVSWAGVYLTP